jgi:CxxC-x17-CxxC domain-containing protein
VAYTERNIQCVDCGANFPFTAEDQEFFAKKGYTNEPKRCPSCRQVRKTERGGEGGGGMRGRQSFTAICAQCGKTTELPFEPRQGRPVYCRDCFAKQQNR